MNSVISQGVSLANQFVQENYKNVSRPDGASISETQIINSASGLKLASRRVEDSYRFAALNKAFAEAESVRPMFEVSTKLADALGDPSADNFLSTTLINFMNDFNIVQGTEASSARSQLISSAHTFTNAANSYVDNLKNIKSDLESDISRVVVNINNCIDQVHSINNRLGRVGKDNNDLLQQRDDLVSELSHYLSIEHSFSPDSGKATIRTRGGNTLVNDTGTRLHISYVVDPDLLSHNIASDVMGITEYTNSGRDSRLSHIQVNDVRNNFGGELAGLLEVRDNLLPKALKDINDKISQVADKVNELHNRGSGFPPPTSLTSSNAMLLTDSAIFSGKINLGITDDQGNIIKDINGNYVKPITIDFDKLTSRNSRLSGQFTTQDIIDEINQVAAGYGKTSVGLGSIVTAPGEAPEWLIDQVRLVPTSDIAADGSMSFQLELNSGSNVNTSFKVTDMIVINQANAVGLHQAFVSPASINVAAGENIKTGQNIIARLNPAESRNIVRLKMQVTGANGLVEEKWADFTIGNGVNPLGGVQIMNQRSEAVLANNNIGGGLGATISHPAGGAGAAAIVTNAKFGGPLVEANFVDSAGLLINGGRNGYLKISAGFGRIFIDQATSSVLPTNATAADIARNFGNNFGLNNFFTADALNPASNLAVREDIVHNNGLIALGKPVHAQVQKNVMVGQTLPSAVLDIANNPAPSDTLTIGANTFTFVLPAAAGVRNTVVIGANTADTAQNIYNALQNDHMRALVTATAPNGTARLMITAVTQGANVNVACSTVGNDWKVPETTPGGVLGAEVIKLMGGKASAIFDCSGGNVPRAADTITINGVDFNFVAAPAAAAANNITVGANAAATIANLKNALVTSTDPLIAGLFEFTIDPAHPDQLIVTAKNAGFEGNKLQISSNIAAGGNVWKVPGGAPGAAAINSLVGGFSKSEAKNIDTYALKIGVDSNTNMANIDTELFVFSIDGNSYTQTLPSFFGELLSDLKGTYDNNKMSSEVAKKVVEKLHLAYDDLTKMNKSNRQDLYRDFEEAIQMQTVIFAAYNKLREATEAIFNRI